MKWEIIAEIIFCVMGLAMLILPPQSAVADHGQMENK